MRNRKAQTKTQKRINSNNIETIGVSLDSGSIRMKDVKEGEEKWKHTARISANSKSVSV